jgi:hypothetical protein
MAKKRTTKKTAAAAAAPVAGDSLDALPLAALHAELARRQRAAQSLLRRRDRLREQLDEVESELSVMGSSASPGIEPGRKRARNASNLAEAMAGVLKGGELSVTELAQAVQAAGYATTSPNFRTIVNQTLIKRRDLFKRVGRGLYATK